MAALDAKKAFYRVNHIELFEKLIECGFPQYSEGVDGLVWKNIFLC